MDIGSKRDVTTSSCGRLPATPDPTLTFSDKPFTLAGWTTPIVFESEAEYEAHLDRLRAAGWTVAASPHDTEYGAFVLGTKIGK